MALACLVVAGVGAALMATADRPKLAAPVTRADEAAHAVILKGLAHALPGMPVVSEEACEEWQGRAPGEEFILVDPLDGTAEFIAGRPEYTVNIALLRAGTPVVGVVAAPALGLIWRGAVGSGATRLRFSVGDKRTRRAASIHTRAWPEHEPAAAVSRTHFDAVSASLKSPNRM